MLMLFVSDNDPRSLLTEAVARKLSRLALINVDIMSCTVERMGELPKVFYQVLKERGYPAEDLILRTLQEVPYEKADVLITLSPSARDACPYVQTHKRREHWNIEEFNPTDLRSVNRAVDQMEERVRALFKLSENDRYK